MPRLPTPAARSRSSEATCSPPPALPSPGNARRRRARAACIGSVRVRARGGSRAGSVRAGRPVTARAIPRGGPQSDERIADGIYRTTVKPARMTGEVLWALSVALLLSRYLTRRAIGWLERHAEVAVAA